MLSAAIPVGKAAIDRERQGAEAALRTILAELHKANVQARSC